MSEELDVQARNWAGLVDAIRFYRSMDFFAEHTKLSDEELAAFFEKRRRDAAIAEGVAERDICPLWEPISEDAIHPDLRPSNRNLPNWWGDVHPDLGIVNLDKSRIWWEPLETDYYPGKDNFVPLLTEWSQISLGAFVPTNIQEHWPDDGVMYLEFDLNGDRHKIVPWKTMPIPPGEGFGWTDIGMTLEINNIIRDTGYAFCVADQFDETAFMFVVKIEDRRRMKAERGWKFLGNGG